MIKMILRALLLTVTSSMALAVFAAGMNASTSDASQQGNVSSGMSAGTNKKMDVRSQLQQPAPKMNINVYTGANGLQTNPSTSNMGTGNQNNQGNIVPAQFGEDDASGVKSLSPNGKIMSYPNQDGSDQ